MTGLLSGLRVVELVGPFGNVCSSVLESLGASVTRLEAAASDAALAAELETADVWIDSEGHARRPSLDAVHRRNPRLIQASITAFGSSGPRAEFRGGELVCAALSGVLRLVGDPDRAPCKEALDACVFHAEAAAAAAILVACREREGSGRGQHVDVSIQEVAASRLTNSLLLWQFDRRQLERSGGQLRYGRATVRCIWELQDGYAFHTLMSGRFGAPANAALSAWIDEVGGDNPLRSVDWLAYDRSALPAEVRAVWEGALDRFFRARTKWEIATEGRRRGINAAVVQEPADVLDDPQLAAREFWVSAELEGTPVRVPGAFMSVREGPIAEAHGGAARLDSAGAALGGVRVLDLSWALVGSLTTKALGDHGACVVKLESAGRPCLTRIDAQVARSSSKNLDDKPWFAHLNTSKRSLDLDLKHPRAREVLDPLIAWADVIVENFSPGTLQKLELDYDTLKQRRPDLIMVSASAYGQTGPLAQSWGVDGTSAAMSARTWLTGWGDRPPVTPGAVPYADVVVPQFLVAAIGAALVHKHRTGQGCYADVSMYEISVHQMSRALSAAQLRTPLTRNGNRDRGVWHQGVYPARGDDRWIAVSWFDREDYGRFIEVLGGTWPDASELEREEGRDAFDRQLAARTCELEDFAWMEKLQAAGIAAGVVQDIADVLERDPQLRARPAWVSLDHAVLGAFEHQTVPYHLDRTPAEPAPAPRIGEHTEWVCRELCGLSESQFRALVEARVIAGPRS